MKLYVGRNSLEGDIARYARRFDILELRTDGARLPKPARLREWAEKVRDGFVFSVVVPKAVAALTENEISESALEPALKSAEALKAQWFLVQTPPSVPPSQRMRDRLQALRARLSQTGMRVAWEPRGVWEAEQADEFAEKAGLHVVRDLSRFDPPDAACIYTRLLGLGEGARVRPSATLRVAEALEECEEAFVIIEGKGALQARRLLRSELGIGAQGAEPEEEFETDEEVDEDDLETEEFQDEE